MNNAATQAELIRDEAIDKFNERMSNASTSSQWSYAVNALSIKVGGVSATRLYHAWMEQQVQAAREARR